MTPIVAIVGRPNVGKSTLFNRLTRSRQALVDDLPGVTRDRLYGQVRWEERVFTLVDTGGFDPPADQAFASEVHSQVELALAEADAVLFITDGRAGLSPLDKEVAARLRRTQKPVVLAVNKLDAAQHDAAAMEFYSLGLDPLFFISATHGRGVDEMLEHLTGLLEWPPAPPVEEDLETELAEEAEPAGPVGVALLGRPNVGKSSLLNALVGAPRAVVSQVPGTTRDALDTPLTVKGRDYILIDTAGIRRQGKVARGLEKAMVFRSLRSLERCQVAVVMVDATEGVTDQDLRLVGQAVDAHRGLVLALNKWDLIKDDSYRVGQVRDQVQRALKFAPWAPVLEMSALKGQGVRKLLPAVDQVEHDFSLRVGTGVLNRALMEMVERHHPAMVKGRRTKLYYATQVSTRPPTVVIFVNRPDQVHFSYKRYLINELRQVMGLKRAPLRLILRARKSRS